MLNEFARLIVNSANVFFLPQLIEYENLLHREKKLANFFITPSFKSLRKTQTSTDKTGNEYAASF